MGLIKVVSNKKCQNILLSNMKKRSKTNPMSHFLPFYNAFFLWKFNVKDWIFHSAVIYRPKLCKRDKIMKKRLATNIDGYPLRRSFLLE